MSPSHGRGSFWAGVGLIVLAALSWSTAGLFPRVVSTDMFTTLFWRSALGGLSVLLIYIGLNHQRQSERRWQNLFTFNRPELVMSVFNAIAMLTFVAAFFFTRIADVVFIYSAFPTLTLLMSAIFLGTGIKRLDLACALIVAIGMGLILWAQTSLDNLWGVLLSFTATVMFSLLTIGIKRYPKAEMIKVTYLGAFQSAVVVLPFASVATTSPHDMAWLWLYGFLNVGVGFGFYLLGVRRIPPILASLICMIEIPLAPLWAYLLLGEAVTQQSLAGGAVILIAVLLNMWGSAFASNPGN